MTARLDQVSCAFALLIGINDYRAYDASAGNPAGTSDLPAGRNDVGAFYRMCRALGVPHANIHILTSPKLGPGDVGEPGEAIPCGYLGEATGAEIRAQLAWLAGALAHAPGDTDAPVGLLTYSGHADFIDDHLALCPSDVRAGTGDLEGVLGFPEIQSILRSKPGGDENLTVVLDCCHAAAAAAASAGTSSRRAGTSLTGRARRSTPALHVFGGRMLLAAAPGQVAYQSKFAGLDHGALSWALNVVADQWQVESEGGVDRYTIDHYTLRERAQQLLNVLAFPQTLVLYPEGVAHLPFFLRGTDPAGAVVAGAPDRPRSGMQLDPTAFGCLYAVPAISGLQMFSVGTTAPSGYAAGQEYWSVPSSMPETWPTAITFNATPNTLVPAGFPPAGTTTMSPTPSNVTWPNGSVAGPAQGSGVYFYLSADQKTAVALDLSQLASNGKWTWYYYVGGNTPAGYVISLTGMTLSSTKPTTGWPTLEVFSKLSQP